MIGRLLLTFTMFLALAGFAGVMLTGCDDDPGVTDDMSMEDMAQPRDLRQQG